MENSQLNFRENKRFHVLYYDNGDFDIFSFDTKAEVIEFCSLKLEKIKKDPLGDYKLFLIEGTLWKNALNPFRFIKDDEEIIIGDINFHSEMGLGITEILNMYEDNNEDLDYIEDKNEEDDEEIIL